MHIPDGFLDTHTAVVCGAASLCGVAVSALATRSEFRERHLPLMGGMAAFVFAAQMVNIPVGAGTSGHFLGAALVSIMLGPLAGSLAMTVVLVVQCLLFQDGGLVALGANVFNMALAACFTAWLAFSAVQRVGLNTFVASVIAGVFSIMIAASLVALELSVSGTVPLRAALPAIVSVHLLIAALEGAVTGAIVTFVARVRPDLAPAGLKVCKELK